MNAYKDYDSVPRGTYDAWLARGNPCEMAERAEDHDYEEPDKFEGLCVSCMEELALDGDCMCAECRKCDGPKLELGQEEK